jgi:hypothetical protein
MRQQKLLGQLNGHIEKYRRPEESGLQHEEATAASSTN